MKIELMYGTTGIEVDLPFDDVDVYRPQHPAGLADEQAAFQAACRSPIGRAPLRESIAPADRVAIVIPDGTRALPF